MSCVPFQAANGGQWRLSFSNNDLQLLTYGINGVGTPGIQLPSLQGGKNVSPLPLLLLGDTLSFDNLPFNFIIDNKFENYTLLFNTIYNLASDNTPTGQDIEITLLDSNGSEIGFTLRAKQAFPTQLSGFQLVSTQEGETILTATVTFEFEDMVIDNE